MSLLIKGMDMPKSCKDCIHYEPCKDSYYNAEQLSRFPLGFLEKENAEKNCAFFEDRSKYVELPYPLKPRDKVWYILDELDEISLKEYKITAGDRAVGDIPDTVVDVGTLGFLVNQLSERNVDFLVPEDCEFISWDELGKSYFLTREEAEQALKECDNENS